MRRTKTLQILVMVLVLVSLLALVSASVNQTVNETSIPTPTPSPSPSPSPTPSSSPTPSPTPSLIPTPSPTPSPSPTPLPTEKAKEENHNPVITDIFSKPVHIFTGESTTITVSAYDPDEDLLTYSWDCEGGSISGSGSSVTWKASCTPESCCISGSYKISIKVSDGQGGEATDECRILVTTDLTNHDPVVTDIFSEDVWVYLGKSTTVTVSAHDPDGDSLTYSWDCEDGSIFGSGSSVTWEAPDKVDFSGFPYSIEVEIFDDRGGWNRSSIRISVITGEGNNYPIIISSISFNPPEIYTGETTTVTVPACDPDGDPLTYAWYCDEGSISGSGPSVTWKAPDTIPIGETSYVYHIWFEVSDDHQHTIESAGRGIVVKQLPTSKTSAPPAKKPTTPKPGEEVSVYLHGEKTDVTVGEEIILSLSAVNLITKPTMSLQLILKGPSGMSVSSTEFIESGAGMYTATYTVEPGKERHIGVNIRTNQVGEFNVEGDICYYFGGDKSTAEYKKVKLPVKVNSKPISTPKETPHTPSPTETPGFEVLFVIAGLLTVTYLLKRRK